MRDVDVIRVVERVAQVRAGLLSPPAALASLHKVVEIVEVRLGGGERDVIRVLGTAKATINGATKSFGRLGALSSVFIQIDAHESRRCGFQGQVIVGAPLWIATLPPDPTRGLAKS